MYSFLISVVLLVLGYFLYGRFVEKVFKPDASRQTPAYAKSDGIDYIPMPGWKVFMVELLNIAGTGPIFGAIMGAMYGPACYIWIVLGCIFGGAVHDYFSGMVSLRHDGAGLPDLVGRYLGKAAKQVMLVFTLLLLLLVGAVFVYSPAIILGGMTGGGNTAVMGWVVLILIYYIIATLLPIDKIIGRIYPIFALVLLFMAFSLMACLLVKWPDNLPELWTGLQNRAPANGPIFPCMFITIACGAVSGFHATQSPLMARCLKNERNGRQVFYGSMVAEGFIALVWATVSSYFFFGGGNAELGAADVTAAPQVVTTVAKGWLGVFGGILAVLGVVIAPISTGDTALRSARLMLSDAMKYDQKPLKNRLVVSIPIFIVTGLLLWYNIADTSGFDNIWRYFGWFNQTLSVFTFLGISVYLVRHGKGVQWLVGLIPGCFMIAVTTTFICISKIGFNLPEVAAPYIGCGSFLAAFLTFCIFTLRKERRLHSNGNINQ